MRVLSEQAAQRPNCHSDACDRAKTKQEPPEGVVDVRRNEGKETLNRSFRSVEGDPARARGEDQEKDRRDGIAGPVITCQQHEANQYRQRARAENDPTGRLEHEVTRRQKPERSGADCDAPEQAQQRDCLSHY